MKKVLVALAIISPVLVLIGSCVMDGKIRRGDTKKPVGYVTHTDQSENPAVPVPKSLKAGEWSEWIPIMWRKVAILPSDDGVVYEFRDDEGKVRSVTAEELRKQYEQDRDGRRNLKDTTMDVRFQAKTDVKYVVGRW